MTDNIQNGEGVEANKAAWEMLCSRLQRDPATSEESDTCTLRAAMKAMVAFAASRHSLAREPATADVGRGRWTHVQTPPSVGGHYAIGGYVESGGMPRHFERAFANVILTIDGPSWSHCDDRKAHIPIEYWQDLGAHPEHAVPSSEPAIAEGERT